DLALPATNIHWASSSTNGSAVTAPFTDPLPSYAPSTCSQPLRLCVQKYQPSSLLSSKWYKERLRKTLTSASRRSRTSLRHLNKPAGRSSPFLCHQRPTLKSHHPSTGNPLNTSLNSQPSHLSLQRHLLLLRPSHK